MRTYSEKYIQNYKTLKEATIGFEFEFYSKRTSYYKMLEILNEELAPVKVHGFRQYHSDFEVDADNFKMEPDLSGGSSMIEIITGPLDYFNARFYLLKLLKFIQEYGYTNDKCSLHINISYKEKNLKDLNLLKQILTTNEDAIYEVFPSRKNNIYAKSIKNMIPFEDYDFSSVDISIIKNVIKIPKDKYYGINFSHADKVSGSRLEYRYLGGKDYEQKSGDILDFMDQFIINTYNNIGSDFDNNDIKLLGTYLDGKINSFKTFSSYDKFIVDFPSLQIQVDQRGDYDIIKAYYGQIYKRVFKLIESTDGLTDGVINFVIASKKIEVVDCKFSCTMNIKDYDFINCNISDGVFENCEIVNSEVVNTQLTRTKVYRSDVKDSKLLSCNVDNSDLTDCFFMEGFLDGHMEGGIFRSGKVGPNGSLSTTTKLVTGKESFFGVKHDDIEKGNKKIPKFKG